MVEAWYRRGRIFLLEQRKKELEKANARYPDSLEFPRRFEELEQIEAELKELKE